jgi:hypothetical protein
MLVRLMQISGNGRFQIVLPDQSENCNRLLPPLAVGSCDLPQKFDFVQTFARPFSDRAQRIFGNVHWQPGFFAQEAIETTEQSASAREHETAIDKVGG